ncbi:MAG: hypothetical protein Q9225_000494 [Loekoesia sp. 1 TL-2023]
MARSILLTLILELVADARAQRDEAIRHVYSVLKDYWRKYIKKNGTMRPVTNLMNAGRYGELWQYQELVWRGGEGTEIYEADPLSIPNLKPALLSHLSTISTPNPPASPSTQAQCPKPYPHILFQHPLLPWIWDFNDETVTAEQQNYRWDLLIRHISSLEIIEPGKVIEGLPLGFRNQRRIWALVEDLLDAEIGKEVE